MIRVTEVARGLVIYLRYNDIILRNNKDEDKDMGDNQKKVNSMFCLQ